MIDDFLRYGSNSDHARELTAAEFMKEKPIEDHAVFLQKMYHGGYGLNTDGGKFAAWYTEEGLRFAQGITAEYRADARILSWNEAAERIDTMLTAGTFASNVELEEALGTERRQIAESIWFLRQDLSEDARDRYLPSLADMERYPADTGRDRIADRIAEPEFRSRFEEDLRAFITDYAENRDLLRFRYHRPAELLARVEELDLPMRSFSSALPELPPVSAFITEDEIDRTLGAGGSYEGARGRIAAYFAEEHTSREKIAFLKKEYGEGGRSHALSMSRGSMEDYDSRGIRLRK
ncbi:MAG: DEAD/DEAH box helicase, partial [Clostridia bacterium]|nr:DEAD/DEAH box helicase [Clostridia bacterium]